MKLSRKFLLLTIIFCFYQPAFADYDGETTVLYSQLEDSPSNDEITILGIDAVFNIDTISTKDGPLAEAAFLNPASNIRFSYEEFKIKAPSTTLKQKQTLFGGSFVTSSKSFQIGFQFGDTKFSTTSFLFPGSTKTDDLLLGLNFYINKGQMLGYSREIQSFDDTVLNDKITEDHFFYRQLFTLDSQQSIAIEVGHSKTVDTFDAGGGPDDTTKFNDVNATYYINRNTGIFLGIGKYDSNDPGDSNGTLTMVGVESFITPAVGLAISYVNYAGDSALEEDTKGFALILGTRF